MGKIVKEKVSEIKIYDNNDLNDYYTPNKKEKLININIWKLIMK